MASAWLHRNVCQVCDGGPRCRIKYLETVDSAISKPSLSNSPECVGQYDLIRKPVAGPSGGWLQVAAGSQPPAAAPERKPMPVPPSSRAPTTALTPHP
jgi:hypothetical protein